MAAPEFMRFLAEKDSLNIQVKELSDEAYEFATNKRNSLKDRFKVWEACCIKSESCYYFEDTNFPLITAKFDKLMHSGDYNRGTDVDYYKIIEAYSWSEEQTKEQEDAITEEIIAANYGSYKMDW